ncbi:hypothetical protein Tco_0719191 [Tanacetum coccineum]
MYSTEAKYIATAEASMEAVWMKKFIDGLGGVMQSNKRPMEMLCDNESALAIASTLFSIICGIRQYLGHLTKEHHVGFEAAAWDRRDYGRSCSPRNDPKLDLGLFEIVPFNRNQRCFLVSRFFSEQIEEPNGSNSSLAATKESVQMRETESLNYGMTIDPYPYLTCI